MPGTEDTGVAFRIIEEIFEQEEFEMMTKQAELKKQAYASTLKSRALSVLIYLIDRSNKELTCFPAIPTMAEHLHISVSTVKRALHELLDSGYIKKDARFREKNKGQTSNLYTLVLFDGQPTPDDGQDSASGEHTESEMSAEASQEKVDGTEKEMCQVEHISFDTLTKQKENVFMVEGAESSPVVETVQGDGDFETQKENRKYCSGIQSQKINQILIRESKSRDKEETLLAAFWDGCCSFFPCQWTGEGVILIPP